MSSRNPAVGGALFLALAVPATAQAIPTMEPLKPCYVTAGTAAEPQAEGIAIRAAGFTPNAKVNLTLDQQPVPGLMPLQTDQTGALVAVQPIPAPFIEKGSRDFTVTLTEEGAAGATNTVTSTARTTALGVSVKPKRAKPSRRIRFKGSGFTASKAVYAHYVYRGKVRKTVRMARKTRGCGNWSVRKRQIPVSDPKTGLWTVQFDQSRKYVDPSTGTLESVFVRLGISVELVRD